MTEVSVNVKILSMLGVLFFFCCASGVGVRMSADDQETQTSARLPEPKGMAPGTVKTTVSVISSEEKGNSFSLVCRVVKVHGYGAATPPLSEGSEILISPARTLAAQAGILGILAKPENPLIFSLEYMEGLGESSIPWRAFEIH